MMAQNAFTIDLDEPFEHLDSSPIAEAVIHWGARAGQPLEEAAMRQQLTERLPAYPQIQPQRWQQLNATLGPEGATSQHIDRGWHGFRLESDDKLFVVQFTRDGVAFSRLEPYHNWAAFSAVALEMWSHYREIAQPVEVQRLGVRFINRVRITSIEQGKRMLSQPPKCLAGMNLPSENFMYQSTHRVPDRPYAINVTRMVPPAELMGDDQMSLIVDIDAFTTTRFEADDQGSREHLSNLRWLKDKAFFSLMTKMALARFAKKRGSS